METLKEIIKEYNTTKQKVDATITFIMSDEFEKLDKMSKILIIRKYDSLNLYKEALKAILIHNNVLN